MKRGQKILKIVGIVFSITWKLLQYYLHAAQGGCSAHGRICRWMNWYII